MQLKRKSTAVWNGTGKNGTGKLTSQSGVLQNTQYGFQSRFADGIGTNPEELIAAAHAGCFSMNRNALGEATSDAPAGWLHGGLVHIFFNMYWVRLLVPQVAELYGAGLVEELVGQALDGVRDRVFLASKVQPEHATYAGTVLACERSLGRLRTDHLDLYLLHWRGALPLEDTLRAMITLRDEGKIRAFGVSNFDVADLEQALEIVGEGQIACNQVLYHLGERDIEHVLLPFCERHRIAVVGYSPFGSGEFPEPGTWERSVLDKVARAHAATAHAVALRFLVRRPALFAIPKASSMAHVEANADAGDLVLSDAEIAALSDDELGALERLIELPDPDLYAALTGDTRLSAEHASALFDRIKEGIRYGFAMGHADFIMAETPFLRDYTREHFPKVETFYVPKCIWLQDWQAIEQGWNVQGLAPERAPVILFAGQVIPRKGVHDLLTAFAVRADKYPSWTVEIVGPYLSNDYARQLEQIVASNNLQERVQFVPMLTGEALYRRYRASSIYCMPTHHEGMPTTVLEAMYFGGAIVAGNAGFISHQLDDEKCGLLIEPGNVEALREKLDQLMASENLRQYYMQAARARMVNTFAWELYFDQVEEACLRHISAARGY